MNRDTLLQHKEDKQLLGQHMKRCPKGKQRKYHAIGVIIKRNRVSSSGRRALAMRIAPLLPHQKAILSMYGEKV